MPPFAVSRPPFVITTDPDRLDLETVWAWLREAYWSAGIPRETVARAFGNAIPFSILEGDRQVGCARVVTDRATFAYLADVFIAPTHRGRGLSVWLMETIRQHPDLQGLRRWMLGTRDAHGVYAKVGFRPLAHPEIFMEIHAPDVYRRR
ncbi:MAG TPA: GNAT family N-acetyltransferase [Polyangia bacterium]|nr:GNAT family N-acetyltransferase [Polyangia bacterium]